MATIKKIKTVFSKTPLRVTLAGGGTDVLWYSRIHDGAWISAAITKYVNIKLYKSQNQTKYKTNPIVTECLKLTKTEENFKIKYFSDIPPKSGLGGSGAFEVGLLNALYHFQGKKISQEELARIASDIEMVRLKRPVGPQDQYITALGGIKYFEIDKKGRVTYESLKLAPETIAQLEENLIYLSTDIQRDAAGVLGDVKRRLSDADKQGRIISALNEIKSLGQMAKKYLVRKKIDDFGATFHQHWLIKKSLSSRISSNKIDEWYNEALKAGALGGKIMGAGGGGWFVFYVNKDKNRFREKMARIGLVEQNVKFDWKGTVVYEEY